MIGASWGVEWCVVGVDRNWANNPAAARLNRKYLYRLASAAPEVPTDPRS